MPRVVRTSQGLEVHAEAPRAGAEWVIMPGGGWDARDTDPSGEAAGGAVGAFARAHRRRGGKLAAVCTGAMWLAEAGLIGGRPATTHHRSWDALAAMGAQVRRGARVVDDGDLVTSGGITSGLFLGLHLVERLLGAEARRGVEMEIELPTPLTPRQARPPQLRWSETSVVAFSGSLTVHGAVARHGARASTLAASGRPGPPRIVRQAS